MGTLRRGRYLTLVTQLVEQQLGQLDPNLAPQRERLHAAEAGDRLALHLARLLQSGIEALDAKERVARGVALVAALIDEIGRVTQLPLADERPAPPGDLLTAVLDRQPDGQPRPLVEPLVPLLDTALMTNAPGEPRIGQQIATEIPSADGIDLIMAFIRHSGIQPLLPALRLHCESGRPLRVLTTSYTGSTEARALQKLVDLGAQVRVSYDVGSTRLHAKAWHFLRHSGHSTAFVGSSNLTHSAQVAGLEWNVRFSARRNPQVVDKVAAVFESYWNSTEFVPFDLAQFTALTGRQPHAGTVLLLSPIEVRLEPFQERLLEQIELARGLGRHRNLLVAATGTGKTVMAAVDFARLRARLPRARLLFVAHRRELLEQSLATFRHVLREPAFGELWVDGQRAIEFSHVFASIQSLHSTGTAHLDPAHFDVVIVDEFHHAEAQSYRLLLEHLQPRELLGLTATPERTDGLDLLHWFDGRMAAELRLWDAIDQHRLVPFAYYGIADALDYRHVPWQRGRGYSVDGLTKVLTADGLAARAVVKALADKVSDLGRMRALGFCVSVAHARFMARVFSDAGIRALAVWADSSADERARALHDLASGGLQVLFSVDLFNEGVDLPSVDTLLLLRPTDSPVLFLQQLGRGLRRHEGKALCTVLDFIGQHRKEFRSDLRLRALLGGDRRELVAHIERGFPFLPAGCHMELDRIASERVLAGIRAAIPERWQERIAALRSMTADGRAPSLNEFLADTGLELTDIYQRGHCWSDMLEAAGITLPQPGPQERNLRRAITRLLHLDDVLRIDGHLQWLGDLDAARLSLAPPQTAEPNAVMHITLRLQRMLLAALCERAAPPKATVRDAIALLSAHPTVVAELLELLPLLRDRREHLGHAAIGHPMLPLTVHARYSRREIQAAFGDGDAHNLHVPAWREGVRWMAKAGCDVFLITLDKTGARFSPTTRYRDYAISPHLIHWESQSRTRADSPTGQRYQRHAAQGSDVMLFARQRVDERCFHFLGPACYVRHRGELPMQVTWQLVHAMPGDLFARFAAAVA